MTGLLFFIFLTAKVSILDLPRHYADQGDMESAIRAYSEIYRTSNDSVVKYQALYEQAELYLKKQDTLSAIMNLYRLSARYLPDSVAGCVFKRLVVLDRARFPKNSVMFARLYPYVKNRRVFLNTLLKELKERNDTVSYIVLLRILASDYGGEYKKNLSEYVYKNKLEDKIFNTLFEVNPNAPYYYYIHKNDTFGAFYTLFGKDDLQSKRLRLKILFDLGAYHACFGIIGKKESDPFILKLKLLSAVRMRVRADSIVMILKKYRGNKKLYKELISFLDTLPEYGLLRSFYKNDMGGILYNGLKVRSGLKDTVFYMEAVRLTKSGEYKLARELMKSVKRYYPEDSLELWKDFLERKKLMPQDILLDNSDIMGKVKNLFVNAYYAELIQYAKRKELPTQAVPYIAESLYMLWKLYGRKGYLNSAFKLAEKYRALIPRNLYFRIVYDYDPGRFDIERYNYKDLTYSETHMLFYLLRAQNKAKLIKDFGSDKASMFLYYLAVNNIDSALYYIPEDQLFYGMFVKEFLPGNTRDSLKVFNYFKGVKLDYMKTSAKFILRTLIKYALSFKDYFATDTLLKKYEEYYGRDRFFAYAKARWHYMLGDYRESLVYSLFYSDGDMQAITAASLLKLGKIEFVSDLRLNRYDLNLLYLKTGALLKVNVALLDRSDALSYLNELTKSRIDKRTLKNVLNSMLKKNIIDSMTFNVYAVFNGFVNKDSVYLNSYAKSFLKYLMVKSLMRKNLLDSALEVIKNPENDVDSFQYHLYFKKGTMLYLKHRYKKAYKYYRKAEGLESLNDAAMFNAYLAAKRANMKQNTIKSLMRYIEGCVTCEKLPDAYISLGFNLLEAGLPDSAIKVLKSVEGYLEGAQEAELKYWLGMAFMQDSAYDVAEGYFMRVYRFHQKDGQWGDTGGLNAARLSYMLGVKRKARNIYMSIIRRRKDDVLAQEAKKELKLLK